MKKLIFIMDDSEAFLRSEVKRISNEWGFTSSTVKEVEEWNAALVRSAVSLFGDVSMIHLDLSDKNKLKKFADMISDKRTKDMFASDNWFGHGLIITSTHARGAKKIENLVKASGGKVIKKAKPAEMRKELLGRMKLNKETMSFVESYVGDDYNMLLSVVNEIEKTPEDEQMALTTDELIIRLPGKPGAVPPWEFIDPMLNGDTNKAIELFERALTDSHVLVAMLLARKKLQLLYRLRMLHEAGIWRSQEQAKVLNERNSPNIWTTDKVAKRVSIQTAEYLAKLALLTEANIKGKLHADPNIVFKNFIAQVSLAIRHNRPYHIQL